MVDNMECEMIQTAKAVNRIFTYVSLLQRPGMNKEVPINSQGTFVFFTLRTLILGVPISRLTEVNRCHYYTPHTHTHILNVCALLLSFYTYIIIRISNQQSSAMHRSTAAPWRALNSGRTYTHTSGSGGCPRTPETIQITLHQTWQ